MIRNQGDWDKWVENNKDPYGKACVDVAYKAMEIMERDYEGKPINPEDTRAIICAADKESDAGGITGFMAGCAAQMISHCYVRGCEFRKAWNLDIQIGTEGEKANESGGILNPAIMTVGVGR